MGENYKKEKQDFYFGSIYDDMLSKGGINFKNISEIKKIIHNNYNIQNILIFFFNYKMIIIFKF